MYKKNYDSLSNLVLRRFLKTVTESHSLREQSKEFHKLTVR